MTLTMDWVWLIVCLGMLVLEVITVGNLVSLWFSFGALAALGTTFLTDNVAVQLAVFAIVSVAALIMIRPMTKKSLTRKCRFDECRSFNWSSIYTK
ncbi:NfeD family protein [Erysipelothrix rhusiopathiae SY1027]|uniref:NfeD family protein n=1 Tax=Erysipelothrix rhusiopathiae TaxID=1648 RepID=UPI0003348CDE|nr:NfeD family protein [Erysipelothrix rhusiopathiae]AGN24852.1 NfeD family protein [Erysipelothrix rhusiopathiae SY1027]